MASTRCSCFKPDSDIRRDPDNVAQLPDGLSERMGQQLKRERHRRLGRWGLVGCALAVLVGGYAYGTWRLAATFLPGTTIMGTDVGGMSPEDAAAAVSEGAQSYQDEVSAGEYGFTIVGSDISFAKDAEASVSQAWAARNIYAWPLELFLPRDYQVDEGITFDEQQLARVVSRAAAQFDEANVSSGTVKVSYDYESGTYVAEGEAAGTALDVEAVLSAVEDDVREGRTRTTVDEEDVMRDATLEDTEAYRGASTANTDLAANIALVVNGEVKTHINYEIPAWLDVDEGGTVAVDDEAISTWCTTMIADYLNTADDTNTYDVDLDALAQLIRERLLAGDTSDIDVPVIPEERPELESQEAYDSKDGWDESRGRYIDVDLAVQYARMYDTDGSTLWESAIVSGNPSAYVDGTYYNHSTPQGTYYINAKMTNQTLVGLDENHDGESDYESFVSYWMPFSGNVVAFHDATWRVFFGGDIYETDGSHGCVNLPYDKAEELFGIIQVGDEVYLHE